MPIFRDDYLRNIDEPIVAQKRIEAAQGEGFRNALLLAGSVAGFVLLRKKIALTRTISQELQALGRGGKLHEKYIVKRAVEATARKSAGIEVKGPRRWGHILARWGEEIGKPLPLIREEFNIANMALQKRFPKISLSKLPTFEETRLSESSSWLGRIWKGPSAAAIAPEASAGMPGLTTGRFGGLYAGGDFYKLGLTGEVERTIKNVRVGSTTFEGRLEAARLGLHEGTEFTNARDFTKNILLPRRSILEKEEQWSRLRIYLEKLGVATDENSTLGDLKKAADQFISRRPDLKDVLTPSKLFRKQAGSIRDSVDDATKVLLDRELAKKSTHIAYKTYRAQVGLGIGEMYARTGAGQPQFIERLVRGLGSFGAKHPVTGRLLQIDPRTYVKPGVSIGGFWRGDIPGKNFLYPASGTTKRAATSIVEGTFFGIPEEMFGIGITTRASRLTNFMSKALGAEVGSYGDLAIRSVGRYARIGAAGFGAYYSFKFINYLARQATGGWGVTDVAGKMYTGSREFQQNLLDQVGFVESMRKTEKAFPGTVKSPLAHSIRATSPLWMAYAGKRMGGAKGGRIGLALGLATALITWGDITQDPDELHRIFTGEQDIPIRKGRYWIFGKTPLFGGKIMYWRPHWYPLMRSKYKFQGQLWDSETEYWAQGTPFSPVLAPILQGKLWDPYYWEKKHYQDRPYPLTAELFEPTMPFAWLGNMTLGQLIKPQRVMHPEVWGTPQPEATEARGMVSGAGSSLGMGAHTPGGMIPAVSPDDPKWQASMGLYTLTEQMGLRGFMSQQFIESLTGRPDFLPDGPIIQSARRATGYERGYWEMNIGDPFGATEFFRRILPHRRRAIEEWNPIRNTMPEWLPGSEYYKDFLHGDPFCLSADTLVEVFGGYKKASEIISGDIVKTHSGEFTKIKKVIKRKILNKEKSYLIHVSGVNSNFEFSEDHPVFSIKRKMCSFGSSCICREAVRNFDGFCDKCNCFNKFLNIQPEFIKVKNINVGDIVVYPINNKSHGHQIVKYNFDFYDIDKHNPLKLFGELLVDLDLAWLFGVYTAEGSTAKQNNRPVRLMFSLNKDEYDFAKLIEEKIATKFNSYPKWTYRENSLELIYCDAKLARIFDQIIPGNLYNKRIPEVLYKAAKNIVFSYVSGLIVGDGSLSRNNLVVECANEKLSQDVFKLLSSVGIAANYIKRNNRNSFGFSIHPFNIKDCDLSMLVNKIPSVKFDRQPAIDSWSDDTYIYRLVVTKEEIELKEVYGFEVDDKDSSFCVFGFATHNTKIEMGEARLPGPGYESLHRLHSGIPNVYDAVDRFLILSDIAPYSDQYKQYRYLAKSMVRGDDKWSEKVKKHIKQRSDTQKEYDFLDLEPPEDVTGPLRGLSTAYRHGLAAITNTSELLPLGPFEPIAKLLPYKTAVGSYKDYRLYGDTFTSWGHPIRDFIAPWMNKVRGRAADLFGMEYISGGEQDRREYEEYFDRLKYTKYNHLASLAGMQGDMSLKKKLKKISKQTMTDVNPYGGWTDIYRSMPKGERSFYQSFVEARREDRGEILDMVPPAMQRLYKSQWNIADKKEGLERSYDTDNTASRDTVDFFKTHHLPPSDWAGWHPDVNLKDVQLKVIKQEAKNIHDFGLWESQERAMKRRPYVPTIGSIHDPTIDLSVLQNALQGELQNQGLSDSRIFITRTPAMRNILKMNFKVKRRRTKQYDESMRDYVYA